MIENISDINIKEQFKNNPKMKMITYVVGGLVALVLIYFLYRQFIWGPANEKSKAAYYVGLNYADKDSTDAAITQLTPVVNKFDGKVGGEVAQFVLARQFMAKGQYEKALDELEGVNVSDTYVAAMTQGLIGDCYSEQKKFEEALAQYDKAAKVDENEYTTPMYMFKAGLVAEKLENFEKASMLYKEIKEKYSDFARQKSIEKYIARASNNITE